MVPHIPVALILICEGQNFYNNYTHQLKNELTVVLDKTLIVSYSYKPERSN